MRQFVQGNEPAFADLERRARNTCIRFRSQELPPGCTPEQADVGFEIDSGTGATRLLVSRGIRYEGEESTLIELFSSGIIQFPTFGELVDWIQGPLNSAFNPVGDNNTPSAESATNSAPEAVTDMEAVEAAIPDPNKPLYLDEEVLLSRLKERVLGQDGALKVLATITVRHLARKKPSRPAVGFAVGPSGVGKTRSAEVLAQILRDFDDECTGYQYLRLDMSEYQEAHRVSQLLGAPQGYIGHGDGSQLTDALRANPRTIVLFDEIEKAHPSIMRTLMNAMDAGRLSSASSGSGGREIDCRHSFFMFTSNLDAKAILDELESRNAFGNRAVEDEVCRRRLNAAGVTAEIIGRISRFQVYRPLEPKTRAAIIALAITEVAMEYGVNVEYVEPDVVLEIMRHVRSEGFGIRPEKYLIDDMLGPAFAQAAKDGMNDPARVVGQPFECRSLVQNEDKEPESGSPPDSE